MVPQVKIPSVKPCDFTPAGDVVGVDFETYYDADYSVSKMGNWAYCQDPRFNAWAVSVSDGEKVCVCAPSAFPWGFIGGLDWVSHNRDFDKSVYERLQELGILAVSLKARAWYCSAAASAFLQYPRDLAGAAKEILGWELSKQVRSDAKGTRGAASDQGTLFDIDLFQDESDYAATDAVACLAIWKEIGHLWPTHERTLFDATSSMGQRGLCVDWAVVDEKAVEISNRAETLKAGIPWKPALSVPKFKAACEALSVEPPSSTAAGDEEFQQWCDDHEGTPAGQWAADMGQIRRCGRLVGVLEGMRLRRQVNGRMAFDLKYYGATPGRWSGGGGLNVQNLNRKEAEGVELRKCIVAPPGHVLGVADYSQIEARVLLFLAGDVDALTDLAAHPDWDMYELHARKTMGYKGEEVLADFCERTGSSLRQLAKARVLGLGFRCGAETFVRVARIMAGLKIVRSDAQRIVEEYRDSNPKIVHLWNRLEAECAMALRSDPFEYRLPFPSTQFDIRCGRYLIYRDVTSERRGRSHGLSAVVAGDRVPIHGGILAENWTQGTARDVMASAWLRCAAAGFVPVLTVHDELVFELREETAKDDLAKIRAIMEKPLAWAPGLPLKAGCKLMSRYGK